jgi:hypothetical protein
MLLNEMQRQEQLKRTTERKKRIVTAAGIYVPVAFVVTSFFVV